MSFWRTHDDVEVDFLVETDWGYAAVEVKASSTWRNQYGLGLRRLREELAPREVRSFESLSRAPTGKIRGTRGPACG